MNNQWIIILLLLCCGNNNQCCEDRRSDCGRCEPSCGCGSGSGKCTSGCGLVGSGKCNSGCGVVGPVRCNICGFSPCRCRRVRACEEVESCETTDYQETTPIAEEPATTLDYSDSNYLDSQTQYRPEIPLRSDYVQRHNYRNYRQ